MSRPAAVLAGLGTSLPEKVVTNAMLAAHLDTSDEWIVRRTGIRTRRAATAGEATGDLAVAAGAAALRNADVADVDTVILATSTPDHPCPATAPWVADRLGVPLAAAFDLAAVCSGFVYGMVVASGLIVSGLSERVLLIGADTFSSIVDPTDRNTAVIFGDGAGAVVLRPGTVAEPGAVLGGDLGSDGSLTSLITVPGGGARTHAARSAVPPQPEDRHFRMDGKAVFTEAVRRMAESTSVAVKRAEWTMSSVDRLVPHQANVRILQSVAALLDVPWSRVSVDLDRVGNTSAASIPLALGADLDDDRLAVGDRVVLTAFGGGATWGSVALTWPDLPGSLPRRGQP